MKPTDSQKIHILDAKAAHRLRELLILTLNAYEEILENRRHYVATHDDTGQCEARARQAGTRILDPEDLELDSIF